MKRLLCAIFLLLYFISGNAQKMKQGIEYRFNLEEIRRSSTFIWYGWDISKAKMLDYSKFNEGEIIVKKHIPEMLGKLNLRYDVKRVCQSLKMDSVIFDLRSVQDSFIKMDYSTFITIHPNELTVDSIKQIVKSYCLPQNEGVGVVIIIEMMVKDPKRYVTGYVTFFDIATREVLLTNKMKGLPGSKWGFSMYWAEGLYEIYEYFFADYYPKIIKNK